MKNKLLKDYQENKGFDCIDKIFDNDIQTIVAMGYSNSKFNHLVRLDKDAGKITTVVVNGNIGFKSFVKEMKSNISKYKIVQKTGTQSSSEEKPKESETKEKEEPGK